MTSRAIIRQTDLKRMAAVARAEGVAVEVEVDGKTVRVIPNIPAIHSPKPVAKDEIIPL